MIPVIGRFTTYTAGTRQASRTETRPATIQPDQRLTDFINRQISRSASVRFGQNPAPSQPGQYDMVIIGAGPAGVSAAVYAVRRKLKVLLLDKATTLGGYVAQTSVIENYPSAPTITGKNLARRYKYRLDQLNAPSSGLSGLLTVELGKPVMKLSQDPASNEWTIDLENNQGSYKARSVIIATGIQRKKVPIKGFQELLGKGVSMCTICDGPLHKNKDVVIIGHNQAAVDAALYMATLAKTLHFISSKPIQASDDTLKELKKRVTALGGEVLENTDVKEIKGTDKPKSIMIQPNNIPGAPAREVPIDAVFLESDLASSAKFASTLVGLDAQGQVFVDDDLSAGYPGLYAAGDVTPIKYKQITIAEGQGSIAALKAAEYLLGKDIKTDYGKNPVKKSP